MHQSKRKIIKFRNDFFVIHSVFDQRALREADVLTSSFIFVRIIMKSISEYVIENNFILHIWIFITQLWIFDF